MHYRQRAPALEHCKIVHGCLLVKYNKVLLDESILEHLKHGDRGGDSIKSRDSGAMLSGFKFQLHLLLTMGPGTSCLTSPFSISSTVKWQQP